MALKFWLRLVGVIKSISWKFGAFQVVRSRFIIGHLHRFFALCRHLHNSRMKKTVTLNFWLRLVQVFESIFWKSGAFPIVRSHFIEEFLHRFLVLLRRWNNSRTKKSMTLKFWLRFVQVFKSIYWKFGAFSIVHSHSIKGHLLTSFFTMT